MNFSCPENIGEMSSTSNGRFCDSCQKDIFDYTAMSNHEIRKQLKTASTKTCGIFRRRQVMNSNRVEIGSRFRTAFMLVFLLGMSSADMFAQDTLSVIPLIIEPELQKEVAYVIKGTVFDTDSATVPFARIWVEIDTAAGIEDRIYTIADIDGNYKITLPKKVIGSFSIKAQMIGYNDVQIIGIKFEPNQNEISLDISFLEEAEMHIIGMIYRPVIIPKDPYEIGKTTLDGDDMRQWE